MGYVRHCDFRQTPPVPEIQVFAGEILTRSKFCT